MVMVEPKGLSLVGSVLGIEFLSVASRIDISLYQYLVCAGISIDRRSPDLAPCHWKRRSPDQIVPFQQ
jgi:hypothetical protein